MFPSEFKELDCFLIFFPKLKYESSSFKHIFTLQNQFRVIREIWNLHLISISLLLSICLSSSSSFPTVFLFFIPHHSFLCFPLYICYPFFLHYLIFSSLSIMSFKKNCLAEVTDQINWITTYKKPCGSISNILNKVSSKWIKNLQIRSISKIHWRNIEKISRFGP